MILHIQWRIISRWANERFLASETSLKRTRDRACATGSERKKFLKKNMEFRWIKWRRVIELISVFACSNKSVLQMQVFSSQMSSTSMNQEIINIRLPLANCSNRNWTNNFWNKIYGSESNFRNSLFFTGSFISKLSFRFQSSAGKMNRKCFRESFISKFSFRF